MGYARALLQKDVAEEQKKLEKKAKKKGLWGSIGRTVGSLGVMALTGGAVNPVTLGLLTGGASFLGGAIGTKMSGVGSLKGGKFLQSSRKDLDKELGAFGAQNITASLKSGITAGIGQKLKLMKSGETAAKGLDFQDSFAGRGLEKRSAAKAARSLSKARSLQTGEGLVPTGRGDMIGTGKLPSGDGGIPDLDQLFAEEMGLPATGATDDLDVLRAKASQTELMSDRAPRKITGYGYDSEDFMSRIKKAEGPKEIYQNTEGLYSTSIPEPSAGSGGSLDIGEKSLYDTVNKMTDEGYPPTWNKATGVHGLPEEFGIGYIGDKGQIVRPPSRPTVPVASEDEFFTGNNYQLVDKDLGFSGFDEASWAEGESTLDRINAQMVNKLESTSRYNNPSIGNSGNSASVLYRNKWR